MLNSNLENIKRLVEHEMIISNAEVLDQTGEALRTYDVDALVDQIEWRYNISDRALILEAIKQVDAQIADETGLNIFEY